VKIPDRGSCEVLHYDISENLQIGNSSYQWALQTTLVLIPKKKQKTFVDVNTF